MFLLDKTKPGNKCQPREVFSSQDCNKDSSETQIIYIIRYIIEDIECLGSVVSLHRSLAMPCYLLVVTQECSGSEPLYWSNVLSVSGDTLVQRKLCIIKKKRKGYSKCR